MNIFSISTNTICGDDMNNFDNKSDVSGSDIPMGLGKPRSDDLFL